MAPATTVTLTSGPQCAGSSATSGSSAQHPEVRRRPRPCLHRRAVGGRRVGLEPPRPVRVVGVVPRRRDGVRGVLPAHRAVARPVDRFPAGADSLHWSDPRQRHGRATAPELGGDDLAAWVRGQRRCLRDQGLSRHLNCPAPSLRPLSGVSASLPLPSVVMPLTATIYPLHVLPSTARQVPAGRLLELGQAPMKCPWMPNDESY